MLFADLKTTVTRLRQIAAELQTMDADLLRKQPEPGSWSVLQVLEHLNSYNRFYLPEIAKAINHARVKGLKSREVYKGGWFGDYFTNMMKPGVNGQILKRYKSPADHAPQPDLNAESVLKEFLTGADKLLSFLSQGTELDTAAVRVPISISRFIKLKLGDTFRFLIAHQQRHFIQIEQVLKRIGIPKPIPVRAA